MKLIGLLILSVLPVAAYASTVTVVMKQDSWQRVHEDHNKPVEFVPDTEITVHKTVYSEPQERKVTVKKEPKIIKVTDGVCSGRDFADGIGRFAVCFSTFPGWLTFKDYNNGQQWSCWESLKAKTEHENQVAFYNSPEGKRYIAELEKLAEKILKED